LFANAAVIECAEEAGLEELLAGGLERFVVRRIAPTVVQVDHHRLAEIRKLLERLGQTPRITRE
jgi:hypothetical protein